MAVTVDTDIQEDYRDDEGQVSGSEVIYKMNPNHRYIMDFIVTAAGEAACKLKTSIADPTDFSEMSIANDGTQSVNFSREFYGVSFAGLDISSGTWTTVLRRVD